MSNPQKALSALPQEIVDEIKDNPVLRRPIEEALEEVWDGLSNRAKGVLNKGNARYLYQLLSYGVSDNNRLQTGHNDFAYGPTLQIERKIESSTGHKLGDWKEHRDVLMALKPEDFSVSKLETHWLATAFPNSRLGELAPEILEQFLATTGMKDALEALEAKAEEEIAPFLMGRAPDE